MTTPRRPGRISHRDQLLRNQSSMNLYADLYGKPRVTIDIPPAPKPRAPAQPSGLPLEKDVQFDIIMELRRHPMVGLVERVNSGTAMEVNGDGSKRFIDFSHVYSVPGVERMRPSDISVTLKPSGRRLVIEVKRPGWSRPRDERERQQIAYIQHIRACGGYGMVATSWDEVSTELERIARCETTADRSVQRSVLTAGVSVPPKDRSSV